jgi:cytoskeletal protein RodZ
VDGSRVEKVGAKPVPNASLGESLVAARKRRGLSRETAVQQAHIPAHYLQMLEDDDYRRICDRLYLLPFLRKYASFLEIDPEETAMRLLREVQRADESPSPAQVTELLGDIRSARRRDWSTPLLFSGLIAVIVGAYAMQSRHNEPDTISVPKVQSGQPTIGSSPSSLTDIVNPTAQAATTTVTELGTSGRGQRASDTKAAVSPRTHR